MTLELEPKPRPVRGTGLVLVGYRGTGKSTVGQIVANRLNLRFLDADLEIEARAGRSISRIFAELGEPAFRDWEEQTIGDLTQSHPGAVLATGGGAVIRASNRRILADHGFVVWLRAEPAELARRLEADHRAGAERPSLTAPGRSPRSPTCWRLDTPSMPRWPTRPSKRPDIVPKSSPSRSSPSGRDDPVLPSRRTMAPCSRWVRSWYSWVASSSPWGRSWAAFSMSASTGFPGRKA